jgi:hypothetical protein
MQGYNLTCTTSIEYIAKGNFPTSIMTDVMSLNIQYNLITFNNNHTCVIVYDHNCRNPNIGFTTKCEMQGPMRLRVCLGVKHTLTNGEECKG